MPDPDKDLKSLVSSILGSIPAAAETPPAAEPAESPEAAPATEDEAEALIEVYFDLETPEERDATLERLRGMDFEVVTEFLVSVMQEDEDDYVRAQAAAELARRRVPEGLEAIEHDLVDPDEPFFLENAIKTLSEIRGAGFYDTLAEMWRDPDADADTRCEAMLGMEGLDLQRAMRDFVALVEQTIDIDAMQDDQIEIAMMAFVRHGHREALGPLQALWQRVGATDLDPDEKAELLQFVQEGIDLLAAVD